MIAAAASSTDRIFDRVMLALQLRAKPQGAPEQLQVYLDRTVQSALRLLEQPAEEVAIASPEALSLAVALRSNGELTRAFRDLLEADDSQVSAQDALHELEAAIDAHSESAYFSREVYAAI